MAAVCLPHLKDSISPSRVKNKASSSSADQKLLRSDYPHEIFIISHWGDFHSDGTPGTIKPNYENTSPLPVHRCSAGTGGAGSE